MRVLFCVVLLTVGAVVQAQQDYRDYWQNDYDNFDNYDDAFDDSADDTEVKPAETTLPDILELKSINDKFDDYQIEDNRSDAREKEQVEENKEVTAETTAPAVEEAEVHKVLPLEEPEQSNDDKDNGTWDEAVKDDVAPLPVPEVEDNNDNIFEETKDILDKDQDYLNVPDQAPASDDEDVEKIIEEAKKILSESDDTFDANDYDNSDEQGKSDEDVFSENNEEDTPEKVYADLNADIDQLFKTLGKLGESNSNESEDNDEEAVDNIQDYEEKYEKPYKEDVAISWRNAEIDAAESEDSKADHENADEMNDELVADNVDADEAADDDDYENIDDSNLSQIFAENADAPKEDTKEELVELDVVTEENKNNSTEKKEEAKETFDFGANYDDSEPNADDAIDSVINQIFAEDINDLQSYGNDGLVDENQSKEKDAVEFGVLETNTTNAEVEATEKSLMVDDLSSAQLSELMAEFVDAHKEDFDVDSENFAKHIKPIHITLSVDEPIVVTSPDYPAPYPTNNIIDWIFDGPGTGIEMNITDLAVNGALGDYLLVKPGGLDATGQEGLIFSHRLASVRKYRFTDVNRMFVRFEAKPGFQFQRGFSFSVKLIWPLPTYSYDEPEAEPLANPPEETLTLNLAGLTLPKFNEIKGQFLELLADMAKQYIRDNDIEQGMNTTLEVTQITRSAICNIQWPEYENCVEVTFGVPLHYDEEPEDPRLNAQDLDDMWTRYIIKEEFSERLRSLGITEYAIPNDRTVLMVWLVIAAGVLISMAMLAVALWRFNCFEDYTRMQPYGDTDSIQNEKRHLDLYPTPHQTLPPLYSENDYKWADEKYDDSTRVDMGGFANKSYARDEIYDIDSDEDVIAPRDRKGAISPRDFSDA